MWNLLKITEPVKVDEPAIPPVKHEEPVKSEEPVKEKERKPSDVIVPSEHYQCAARTVRSLLFSASATVVVKSYQTAHG
jgi:hypothetical protein